MAAAHKKPVEKAQDVDALVALFTDVERAAMQVRTFEPVEPPPGFTRARFDTHRALSASMMRLYDDLTNLPAQNPAHSRADEALSNDRSSAARLTPPMKDRLCNTVQASVDLAVGAGASAEERGALQSIITSHRCFLDESRLASQPKPGGALKDNADASKVGETVGDAGALRQYAEARAIDMQRCTDKFLDATNHPTDKTKLEECACGVVKRWKFPARATETKAAIPVLASRIDVDVVVAPAGTATTCGPMTVH